MMKFQWPFVSRLRYELALKEKENVLGALNEALIREQRRCNEVASAEERTRAVETAAALRVNAAEARAAAAEERAARVFAEARVSMTDVFAMARQAMDVINPYPSQQRESSPHKSVGQADAEAARAAREQREQLHKRGRT